MFDETYQIIAFILKNTLFGQFNEIPKGVDWKAVYQEMSYQSLPGMIGKTLNRVSDINPELKSQWKREVIAQVYRYYRYLDIQEDVLSVLRSREIPCAIIKGCAAGMYYPESEYRAMGDIDLMVHPKDFQRSIELLLENGYTSNNNLLKNEREMEFYKDGCTIELHKTFLGAVKSEIHHPELFDQRIYEGVEIARIKVFLYNDYYL